MDTPLGVVSMASLGRNLFQRVAHAAPHLPEDPLSVLIDPSSAPGIQCPTLLRVPAAPYVPWNSTLELPLPRESHTQHFLAVYDFCAETQTHVCL